MVKKLKHLALKEIHYQLLNTCIIINHEGYCFCDCWKYNGCRQRPSFNNLIGKKSYCSLCQIHETYTIDRLYHLKSIQQTWKLYIELKEDLQEFKRRTRFHNFWFKHYSDTFKNRYNRGRVKRAQLNNYIKQSYDYLCFLDP